eukprot:scaffold19344_cov24-Phaeocystis_antarctica.AAC.1
MKLKPKASAGCEPDAQRAPPPPRPRRPGAPGGWLHFYLGRDSSLFTTGLPRDPPTRPQPPPARGQHPCRWCCEGLALARLYRPSRGGLAGA